MADGEVLIESKLNTKGVSKGAKEIDAELQDLAKTAEKAADNVEDSFDDAGKSMKDLFKANVSANLVVDALKAIGEAALEVAKQSIEAAADIQASNAQFEQTFKGVENTARKSLKAISKETGIAATRMQDSFTKIFAFTKSAGADTETAMNISERALRAAADSAAYYDVSIEEATETLQSFLKGNYENDAALGIAATETTRNTKANELYAKSFNELSESQKVDVLLAMVEAGNEASGALGQAARESDAWTNVMGELQESWRQLLGVLGSPIIENLTPIIQGITRALQKMAEVTAEENLADGMESFRESIVDIESEFNTTSEAIDRSAALAETYAEKLRALEAAGLTTAESQREYANIVALLNDLYPELNLQLDEQTGLLDENSRAQLESLDAIKKKAQYTAKEQKYTAALEAQADAILAVQEAEKELIAVQSERQTIEAQLTASSGRTMEELIPLYYDASTALALLTREEYDMLQQVMKLTREEEGLNEEIRKGNETIAEQDTQLQTLNAELGEAAAGLGDVATAEGEAAAAAEEAAAAQEKLIAQYMEAKEAARDSIDSQIGYFDEISLKSDTSAQKIVENWRKQQEAFSSYSTNLQKAVDMGLDQTLVQQFADGSTESMIYLDALVNDSGLSVDEINTQWAELNQVRDTTAGVMAGIQENLTVVTGQIGESVDQMVTQVSTSAPTALSDASNAIQNTVLIPLQESATTTGEAIGEAFDDAANTMRTAWEDTGTWFDSNVASPVKESMEDISQTGASMWADMESETAAAWDAMVKTVESSIRKMQSSIDGLKGKTVDINFNKTGNGASYASASYSGYDGEAYSPAAYTAIPNIPYLATGAVIPPRAPFLAMLGDQRNGTNIEAPLDTIKQAVSEVMGTGGIEVETRVVFEGTMGQLIRMLYPEIKSEARRKGSSLATEVME